MNHDTLEVGDPLKIKEVTLIPIVRKCISISDSPTAMFAFKRLEYLLVKTESSIAVFDEDHKQIPFEQIEKQFPNLLLEQK